MNKTLVNVIPSFLLRGIDPNEILNQYKSGQFSGLHFSPSTGIKVKVAPITFVPISTESTNDPFYSFRDKNGYPHVVAFTNQDEYLSYMKGEKISHICMLCFKSFTHDVESIPLSAELRYFKKENEENTLIKTIIVIGEGSYCCPDHCFTALRMMVYNHRHDMLYHDSEMIYKNIISERFPGLQLKEVDIKLLKRFGGSVSDDEFDPSMYEYRRMNNFIVIPSKIAYEQIKM
jgi:hypothetical protein